MDVGNDSVQIRTRGDRKNILYLRCFLLFSATNECVNTNDFRVLKR